MKDVFVDRLDGPQDPTTGRATSGRFPKLEGPRWSVFVPAAPVVPPAGARLAITLRQDGADDRQSGDARPAFPARRF